MADMEFSVAKRRKKPITFTLEGDPHVFSFKPPKDAVMLMPLLPVSDEEAENTGPLDANLAMTKSTFDWLSEGLNKKDNEIILKRLRDPEDDLDVDTLSDVVKALSEKVAARPTT